MFYYFHQMSVDEQENKFLVSSRKQQIPIIRPVTVCMF